jgi:hypothetical protein
MNWHRYFPKEKLLVIRSESFFSEPDRIYSQVLEFLRLPEWKLDQYSKSNHSPSYMDMNTDTKVQLSEYFRPYNERLYEYLGVDFGWGIK